MEKHSARSRSVNKKILIGGIILLLLVTVSVFAPQLAKTDPNKTDTSNIFTPPGRDHWMGTDNIGRDIWSRFCYGGRISLLIGVIAMLIGTVLGSILGVIAGFYGSWVDSILSWFTEVLMAFPGMLLALSVMAILGPGLGNVMVAVGVGSIPQYMRMARSSVMKAREMDYVEAARCIGCTDFRVLFRHILPNILRPITVLATLGIGSAILEGASLSFLGLGAQPMTPEWGSMLSAGRQFLRNAWWISVFPGLGVFLVILSINFIGEGLGEVLDHTDR